MTTIDVHSPAVQSSLEILQGVITRMATNSANAKAWCIGLVSAILVMIADKEHPEYVWISCVPIVLFFTLDSYYLALERRFIVQHKALVRKLHAGSANVDDLFVVAPGTRREVFVSAAQAATSFSIWPFYGLLIVVLVAVQAWVLGLEVAPHLR